MIGEIDWCAEQYDEDYGAEYDKFPCLTIVRSKLLAFRDLFGIESYDLLANVLSQGLCGRV